MGVRPNEKGTVHFKKFRMTGPMDESGILMFAADVKAGTLE